MAFRLLTLRTCTYSLPLRKPVSRVDGERGVDLNPVIVVDAILNLETCNASLRVDPAKFKRS
jgi:hypothetical protein